MMQMKLKLGYRKFCYNQLQLAGHEFHYSAIEENCTNAETDISIYNAKGQPANTKLFRYKNLIAGYTHIYWAEMENLMDIFN